MHLFTELSLKMYFTMQTRYFLCREKTVLTEIIYIVQKRASVCLSLCGG